MKTLIEAGEKKDLQIEGWASPEGTLDRNTTLANGTGFEIKRIAPMGDPVEIIVKGYSLALRKDEARALLVEQGEQL